MPAGVIRGYFSSRAVTAKLSNTITPVNRCRHPFDSLEALVLDYVRRKHSGELQIKIVACPRNQIISIKSMI